MTFLCPKLTSKIVWLLIYTPEPTVFQAAEAAAVVAEAGCSPACLCQPGRWQLSVPGACLPPAPGNRRETVHYSTGFKNKQANKNPTVKLCKNLQTNYQCLLRVCCWSEWILDKLVLLVLLLN